MTKRADTVEKKVNLTSMVAPKALTLAGLPANQTGFKIVRGDNDPTPRVKRTRARRSDTLLSIDFAEGVTEEDVKATLADYGLEGYAITEKDGRLTVTRDDIEKMPENVLRIDIGNGQTATILKPISNVSRGVAVASIEFAKDYFETPEEVTAWLTEKRIDFSQERVQNGDLATSVCRSEVKDDQETRRMRVDDGVEFVITRSDAMDVPDAFVEVVSETAYGQWGWGQLDFTARMADIAFCNAAEEASWQLRGVVDNILFYSELPVSVRKDLVVRAAGQFADFIGALLDALPARVVVINRSSMDKEKDMGTKDNQQTQRNDDGKEVKEAAAAASEGAKTVEPITRADVEKMIGDAMGGVSAQLAALTEKLAPAQRADEGKPPSGQEAKPADASAEALSAIARSMETLNATLKTQNDRLEKIEGSTVLRSDDPDSKQEKVERKDPFGGIFGRRAARQ